LTVRQLQEAQALKTTLKCGFVVSRKIQGTILGRDARAMAADAGIPIFDTEIEQRIAYAEALTMGKTVFEWGGNNAAIREIQSLTHELLDAFKPNEQVLFPSAEAAAANG
jgi:chromosome partitioning protein